MIALVSPSGPHITVEDLEKHLVSLKCIKIGTESTYVCVWRAPNGRHFTAPNPATMYLVPTDRHEALKKTLENLLTLPPVDGDSVMPGRNDG